MDVAIARSRESKFYSLLETADYKLLTLEITASLFWTIVLFDMLKFVITIRIKVVALCTHAGFAYVPQVLGFDQY